MAEDRRVQGDGEVTPSEFMKDYERKLKQIDDSIRENHRRYESQRPSIFKPKIGEQSYLNEQRRLMGRKDELRKMVVRVVYEYGIPEKRGLELDDNDLNETYEPSKTYAIQRRTTADMFYICGCDSVPRHEGMCPTSVYVEYEVGSVQEKEIER